MARGLVGGVAVGMKRPALAMTAVKPTAFKEAVLPPVLGPVTAATLTPAGTSKSTGQGVLPFG